MKKWDQEDMDWVTLAVDRNRWLAPVKMEINGRVP